jgi:hypothetical protein
MSCAAAVGRSLWLGHDETLSVERLTIQSHGTRLLRYASHRRFDLRDLIDLPSPASRASKKAPEADLEGVAFCDGYLWVVGSHSALRAKADARSARESIDELAKIRRAGNRFLLARIPMTAEGTELTLVKRCKLTDGRELRAARLSGGRKNDALTSALKHDAHLAPFLSIPSKDNGFDIEGIAAAPGGRLFLGLRGPVLDGWACILEVRVGPVLDRRGHLKLEDMGSTRTATGRAVYRKHFLDLAGAGIRDLCMAGRDLLVVTGPAMRGKGQSQVRVWKNATAAKGESLVKGRQLPLLLDLPYHEKKNHAEGVALLGRDAKRIDLLVIYDSASKDKRLASGGMRATVHQIPLTA